MSLVNNKVASEIVFALLRGAQLDTIRVYSLIVQLGFVRLGTAAGDLPNEVWVILSGGLTIKEEPSMVAESRSSQDFFGRRASVLSAVYRLIGQDVTDASVSDAGVLEMQLGGQCLCADADDEENLEEVWSVVSDFPETAADHRWYVSLDECGGLSAHVPYGPDGKFIGFMEPNK